MGGEGTTHWEDCWRDPAPKHDACRSARGATTLFDMVCTAIERRTEISGDSEIKVLLRQSKLFVFNEHESTVVHDKTGERLFEEVSRIGEENWRLPFPITAVEFAGPAKDTMPPYQVLALYGPDALENEEQRSRVRFVATHWEGDQHFAFCDLRSFPWVLWVVDNHSSKRVELTEEKIKALRRIEDATLLLMARINSDARWFVVEQMPSRVAALAANPKKIKRSHQRSIYTLLKPAAIRVKLGLPEPAPGTGTKKRPHERRGHFRTLRSVERFGARAGERIWVRPCWIGPSEGVVGGKRYRVCLEIGAAGVQDSPDAEEAQEAVS